MAKELETRKCVISGKVLNKESLLRFVTLKDGTMLPDFNKKLMVAVFTFPTLKSCCKALSKNIRSTKFCIKRWNMRRICRKLLKEF